MTTIEIINPTIGSEPATEAKDIMPPALSDRLAGEEELKIAYLSNGKPTTRELLSLMDSKLGHGHQIDSRFFEKGSPQIDIRGSPDDIKVIVTGGAGQTL